MPANFRSYEGQLRLLTSVLAAHPELKLNYKEIHKYFGDSTPDGIGFQFRAIKQEATNMRQGKGASVPSTPGGAGTRTPKTPGTSGAGRKRAAPSTKTPASKKAKGAAQVQVIDDDSSEGDTHVPAPTFNSPKVNEEALRAHQARNYANPAPKAAPSLSSAQGASPDDETNVTTPTDAASFSIGGSQAYSVAAYSDRYEPGPFYNPGDGVNAKVKDEAEDDDYEV